MKSGFMPALAIAFWLSGTFVLGKWVQPPLAKFPVPMVAIYQPAPSCPLVQPAAAPKSCSAAASGSQQELVAVLNKWNVSCMRADIPTRTIRPNWENPVCKGPK